MADTNTSSADEVVKTDTGVPQGEKSKVDSKQDGAQTAEEKQSNGTGNNDGSNTDNTNEEDKSKIKPNTVASKEEGDRNEEDAAAQASQEPMKVEIVRLEIVDTVQALEQLVQRLVAEPLAGVDCEGEKLSRSGRLCLVQIALPSHGTEEQTAAGEENEKLNTRVDIYLIDAVQLGIETFARYMKFFFEGHTLKVMHDCRMDSDALFHQFGIRLANVFDLQCAFAMLKRQHWELNPKYRPTRPFVEPFPVSFAKLLQLYCNVLHASKTTIRTAMNEDTTFWSQRPLTEAMREYAASDVQYLLLLHSLLSRELLIDYQMLVYSRSMEYCDQIRLSQDGVQGLGFQPQSYYQRPTLTQMGYQGQVMYQPHYQGRGRGYQGGYRPVAQQQAGDIYQQYQYQQYQQQYYPPQQYQQKPRQHKPHKQYAQHQQYPQHQQQYQPNQGRYKGKKRGGGGGGGSGSEQQHYQQQPPQQYQEERPKKPQKQYQQYQQQQQQPSQQQQQQQQQQQSPQQQ